MSYAVAFGLGSVRSVGWLGWFFKHQRQSSAHLACITYPRQAGTTATPYPPHTPLPRRGGECVSPLPQIYPNFQILPHCIKVDFISNTEDSRSYMDEIEKPLNEDDLAWVEVGDTPPLLSASESQPPAAPGSQVSDGPRLTVEQATIHWDDTIDDDTIDEMKLLGMEKPENVSWGRWMGPRDIKARHKLIIQLACSGFNNLEIARELEMTPHRISIILQNPKVKDEVDKEMEKRHSIPARERMESLLGPALEELEKILTNPQEKTSYKLDAAKYTIDQGLGKAKQEIKNTGSMLSEFIHKLDLQQQALDVTQKKTIETSTDPIDNFINEHIPDSVKVGKRG